MDAEQLAHDLSLAEENNKLLEGHIESLRQHLAECERERDSAVDQLQSAIRLSEEIATVTKERDELRVALNKYEANPADEE